jgi:hypothetical protein
VAVEATAVLERLGIQFRTALWSDEPAHRMSERLPTI